MKETKKVWKELGKRRSQVNYRGPTEEEWRRSSSVKRAFISIPPPLPLINSISHFKQLFQNSVDHNEVHLLGFLAFFFFFFFISHFSFLFVKEKMSWVEEKNLHFTVKFFPRLQDREEECVKAVMEQVLKSTPSFEIRLKSVNVFPNWKKPRVFWISLEEKSRVKLKKLNEEITTLLKEKYDLNDPPLQPKYQPHLTIARWRDVPSHSFNQTSLKVFSNFFSPSDFPSFQFDTLQLLHSTLHKDSLPQYSLLHSLPLSSNQNKQSLVVE